MNTYAKYCPNVFVAKCEEKHEKGEIIVLTTKYGKENKCIVHNLVLEHKGFYYYSITREDGYNLQERAKRKAEKYNEWADKAEKKSDEYLEASQEGKDFLALAEPIKVGHHSEKRHRALIERNWNRIGKSVAERRKAEEHESKAEYWEKMANEINLSIPESLEYYQFELEKAKEYHEGLKSGKYQKEHRYTTTYAKKKVNELTEKVKTAQILWGDNNQ